MYMNARRIVVEMSLFVPKLVAIDVDECLVRELFGEFGRMESAAVHYSREGRPLGSAEVAYIRREDAVRGETTWWH